MVIINKAMAKVISYPKTDLTRNIDSRLSVGSTYTASNVCWSFGNYVLRVVDKSITQCVLYTHLTKCIVFKYFGVICVLQHRMNQDGLESESSIKYLQRLYNIIWKHITTKNGNINHDYVFRTCMCFLQLFDNSTVSICTLISTKVKGC